MPGARPADAALARAATTALLTALALTSSLAASLATFSARQSAPSRDLVGTTFSAAVSRIVDGDTFDGVADGHGRLRIRIFGIDAPERGEPFSTVALRQARVLLVGQRVHLTGRDVDRYGRLVADVSAGGQDVATALLEAGVACHFTRYSSDAHLARAQAHAQARGAGFWAAGAPKPGCATASAITSTPGGTSAATGNAPASRPPNSGARTAAGLAPEGATTRSPAGPFHGNTRSRVYHAPHCRNYHCQNCRAVFATQDEAQQAGFRPAQDCLKR